MSKVYTAPQKVKQTVATLTRVLIVDDSAYVRKMIRQMLCRSPLIEVVGTARNGREALEQIEQLQPDVVTLDLYMPDMDGVDFLKAQMSHRPIPVIVVSITQENGEEAIAALNAGAVDFVRKPTALGTEKLLEISNQLIHKIKEAAKLPLIDQPASWMLSPAPPSTLSPDHSRSSAFDIVVIGVSTGGPQALNYLIPQLPADFPLPIAIVLHLPVDYTQLFAQRLNQRSPLTVAEAQAGDLLQAGTVLIAPAGRHLSLKRQSDGKPDGKIVTHLDARPFDTLHRPAVDVLFRSAAEVYNDRVLGIVMTGMGNDGKAGAAWIKSAGGTIFTEAESSCVVYGMPRAVSEAGLSDRTIPLDQISNQILNMI